MAAPGIIYRHWEGRRSSWWLIHLGLAKESSPLACISPFRPSPAQAYVICPSFNPGLLLAFHLAWKLQFYLPSPAFVLGDPWALGLLTSSSLHLLQVANSGVGCENTATPHFMSCLFNDRWDLPPVLQPRAPPFSVLVSCLQLFRISTQSIRTSTRLHISFLNVVSQYSYWKIPCGTSTHPKTSPLNSSLIDWFA